MMKAILIAAATILQAYLLGSVDTGILVSKFVYHDDVRNHGSGAAGMTNMLRTFGKKAAAMTATGDVLKGVLAVCIGRWLFHMLPADAGVSPYLGVYLAAIFAVLGHLYPLYFGFKGGKGVLVAAGAILAIQPVLLPFLAIIFLVCLIPTGMVSLGSVAMAALYPVLTIIYGSLQGYAAGDMLVCAIGSGFMSGMVIYMHRANIQRIREGKEYRFGKHNKNKSIIKCPAACWFSGSAAGHFCLCYFGSGAACSKSYSSKVSSSEGMASATSALARSFRRERNASAGMPLWRGERSGAGWPSGRWAPKAGTKKNLRTIKIRAMAPTLSRFSTAESWPTTR